MGILKHRDIRENHQFRPVPLTAIFFLILAVWIFPFHEAGADDTGFKTIANIVSSSGWSNFTVVRLNTSDNTRATTNTQNAAGVGNQFTFGIPAGATINGIEASVEGSEATGGSGTSYSVQLVNPALFQNFHQAFQYCVDSINGKVPSI